MIRARQNLVLTLCAAALCLAGIPVRAETPTSPFKGYAYAPGTTDLLYTEKHDDRVRGGIPVSRTEYRNPAGSVIAERTLNFSRHVYKPDYLLADTRDGYEEGAEVLGKAKTEDGREAAKVRVFMRPERGEARKERVLAVPEPCVIDGGINSFIKSRWDDLAAGKRVPFSFVAPARRDWFAFEVVPVGYDEASTFSDFKPEKGDLAFVIRPENKALRLIAPLIRVSYDIATRRLFEYQGISNVNNAKGKSFKVRIAYPEGGP
jgi:hypothetical protein